MEKTGNLPVYYDGQEEMYFKAGKMPSGEMLLAFINIGLDPAEEIALGTKLDIKKARYLTPDGKLKSLKIHKENGKIFINKQINTLDPVIILVK